MGQIAKREPQGLDQTGERPVVSPRVDIYENKEELLVIADMPGVAQDALKIQLDDKQLVLEGRAEDAGGGAVLGREFEPVDYRRTFGVPQGIDRERVSAELRNGVLWLHLPKSSAVKPRQIQVKAG